MEAEGKQRESRRRKKRTENANEAEVGSVTAAQRRSPHNHALQKAQKEKKRETKMPCCVHNKQSNTPKKKDPLTQNIHFFQKPSSTCTVSSNQKSIPCVRVCTFRYKSPLSSLTSLLATGLLSVEFFVVPAGDSGSGSLKSWRMSSLSFA